MKANATPFLNIFEKKLRLEVPLFQRQYVWSLEQQWEPLWEDISLKFVESIDPSLNRSDAPAHFLGAMVLDQKQTPTTHVEKRQIIDGQQRLTTFQIFLSAFRDFCKVQKCKELADECDSFILNKGMMADPEVEKFKVWPTQLDRRQFGDVILAGSRSELENRHPLTYKKYARKPDPRPRMVEAYFYFYGKITEFFLGSESEKPPSADLDLASRLVKCFQSLKNALQVVVIDLDEDDDAQVIFETLNARGEPLLPADLLRNFIFLRAARQNESQEELYEKYWKKFDDDFWRQEVRQGRLSRPRSDLFMQHFLASRQMIDIPVKHLFVEYKFWIVKKRPFASVRDELATLARQGDAFRRLNEPRNDDPLFPLPTFMKTFDTSTVYPLLLFLLDSNPSDADLKVMKTSLESYLLRRSVCGFTTQAYNKIFLGLVRFLHDNGAAPENLRKYLAGLWGETQEWPTDEKFFSAWQNRAIYEALDSNRIAYILQRLNDTYLSDKTERIIIDSNLTIEHLLPRAWIENWPLSDGSKGLNWQQLLEIEEETSMSAATRRRNSSLQTFGNLTILTQPLNSAISNSSWTIKKPQLLLSSLLPINQQLFTYDKWEEETIEKRGKELFERATSIWPAPPSS